MATVSELREMLQDLENAGQGELDVVFSYNYGDYWRTTVANVVDSAEEGVIKYSEYHSMNKVVNTEEDEDGESKPLSDKCKTVIILS